MRFNFDKNIDLKDIHAYLVGGGIASLSAAVYLLRDGHMPAKNINILEQSKMTGGSMDGAGNPESGYVIRGGRMFDEEAYKCIFNILEEIPTLTDPTVSIMDEFRAFNKKIKTSSKARLIDNEANILESSKLGFGREDRMALMDILLCEEDSLGTKTIKDCFPESLFKTNFWFQWTTTFAFEPWHSAIEFKRYLHRFFHELPKISDLSGVRRTPFNQYDSIIHPMTEYLKSKGVNFIYDCCVKSLDFKDIEDKKVVTGINCINSGKIDKINVNDKDFVFVTIGSLTAGADIGDMKTPAKLNDKVIGGDWQLWETIAKKSPEFGNPEVFCERVEESMFESFTVTLKDPTMFNRIIEYSGNQPGTGALMTFKDSGWFMSIVLHNQPHFRNQPDNIQAFWGYSLFPFNKGDYIKKRMIDCTGEEILTELLYHLNFVDDMEKIITTSICKPCILPFTMSQFLTRSKGDRPQVVPKCSKNLAFLGQFSEIPDDVVFTVDYSARSAQTAVYKFLNLDKEVTPIYKGQHDVKVLLNSLKVLMKDDSLSDELKALKSFLIK
ncbi:MAG: oleate hydratase [Clostridiales bacterium]